MPRVPKILQLAVESITRYGVEHIHRQSRRSPWITCC